jgi:hypothetical protein
MRQYFVVGSILMALQINCTDTECSNNCRGGDNKNKLVLISKTFQMNDKDAPKPPTCKLTPPELRERKEQVILLLKKQVFEKKELPDGYSYRFDGTDEMLESVVSFVKTERQCCDFFNFKISVTNDSFIWLEISGSPEAKKFIEAEIEM